MKLMCKPVNTNQGHIISSVLAASWLVSVNCIKNVELFDPLFFHYGEDDNYCQRVRYHGFKVGIDPTVIVRHDKPNIKAKIKKPLNSRIDTEIRKRKIVLADINMDDYNRRYISIQFNLLTRFISFILKFRIKEAWVCIIMFKELVLIKGNIRRSRQRNVRLESLH